MSAFCYAAVEKSRPVEVISVTYFFGSGLPGIANARSIQDTAGVKSQCRDLDSSAMKRAELVLQTEGRCVEQERRQRSKEF